MWLILSIGIVVCLGIILSVLLKPEIKIGKVVISPYWVIALVGAVAMIACGGVSFSELIENFTADTAVNPLKILGVFFGMTVLSVFLDEAGFFAYLASVALNKANKNQNKLFTIFYFTVAILTVFTSNDIIILTFTPFILYFCRNAQIDCKPYLIAEFTAANTFSMLLIIGNPTNIYLAAGQDFLHYASIMFLPAILTGFSCFFLIKRLFKKSLAKPIGSGGKVVPIKDKPLAFTALTLLCICTLLLALSGYINLEMWYIALGGGCAIVVFALIYGAITNRTVFALHGLRRIPWQLAPFLLSMFTVVTALKNIGVTDAIASFLNAGDFSIITYLAASVIGANLLNNIPMSVLFGAVTAHGSEGALYATIIGSNVGALLTSVGALAGIMWSRMLRNENVDYGFKEFVKYGMVIVAVALPAAALGLYVSFWIF